ncbi:MAG: DUF3794 domain-containing protein [Oscillospiraceae bacterium]|nr:DUF3794 domain-containing protein [Oscillospiraceae bacterium]
MELELIQVSADTYETGGDITLTQDESAETIVPDYCPDMARVIATEGTVFVHSQELREGRATVTGSVQVNILYTPDGERGVRALELSLPFTAESDNRALSDCEEVAAEVTPELVEARMLNPRKVLTRCRLSTRLTGYRKAPLCLTTDVVAADAYPLEKLRGRQKIVLLTRLLRREFQFSDTLTLPSGRPGVVELLSVNVTPDVTETRIIGNKLICKGAFTLSLLYLTEENQCASQTAELPFSQIMDVEDVPEDSPVSVQITLNGADIQIDGGDPDGREIGVTLYLEALAAVRREMELELLRDLYSTAWETRYDAAPLTVVEAWERQTCRQPVRELLETGMSPDEILSLRVLCGTVTASAENGRVVLRAPVMMRVLYCDEGGVTLVAERRTEIRCETDLPEGYQVTARAEVSEEPRGAVSERGIEVRFAVDFRMEAVRVSQILCVTAAELDAETPKDTADAPSLVLRRMGADESAWDVAKACNSTVSAILDANCLADEAELPRDTMILIPRKRG